MNKTGVVRESEGLRVKGAERGASGCRAGAVLIRLLQTMGNFLAPRLQSQFMLLRGWAPLPSPTLADLSASTGPACNLVSDWPGCSRTPCAGRHGRALSTNPVP